jgi:hypothetical protein
VPAGKAEASTYREEREKKDSRLQLSVLDRKEVTSHWKEGKRKEERKRKGGEKIHLTHLK